MTLRSVLESLAVPPVPSSDEARGTAESLANKGGSPGSLGSPEKRTRRKLLAALDSACDGIDLEPAAVLAELGPEDVADWEAGRLSAANLAAFASAIEMRRRMEAGITPTHYRRVITCAGCGEVWSFGEGHGGNVLGCPWCHVRGKGMPIPRPPERLALVACDTCKRFTRGTSEASIGHCAIPENERPKQDRPLWAQAERLCNRWRAKPSTNPRM